MSHSRGRKLKSLSQERNSDEVFFMSLDEAKELIAGRYEFLAEKYERKQPKKMKPKSI